MDIALALGSGGVRGISHIGVIKFLEENGFKIRAIAGASAGSIVGAIYAAGYSPREIEEIISNVNQKKIYGRKPDDLPSLMGVSGLANLLTELLGDKVFDELRIPFAAIAVDLKAGQEYVIEHGNVVQAVLASSAVPGVFPPRSIDNRLLIDGGVLNPVPVDVVRSMKRDLPVIAVVLSQFPPKQSQEIPGLPIPVPGPAPLWDQISKLRLTQAFNIFVRSVDIGSVSLAELRLQIDHPEVIIRPAGVLSISMLAQVDIHQLVQSGYEAGKEALPELIRSVSWSGSVRRRFRQTFNAERKVDYA